MIGLYRTEQEIEIKEGAVFINRTRQYLAPAVKLYGEEFITKYKSLAGMGVGIGVGEVDLNNNIYFLFDVNGRLRYNTYIDKKGSKINFVFTLSYLREQPYFVKDYPFDSGLYGNKHMIVLKNPVNNLDEFLKGNYSKMYTKEIINKVFDDTKLSNGKKVKNDVKMILEKNKSYQNTFISNLNKEFKTTIKLDDLTDREYDFPPCLNNEVFNYKWQKNTD